MSQVFIRVAALTLAMLSTWSSPAKAQCSGGRCATASRPRYGYRYAQPPAAYVGATPLYQPVYQFPAATTAVTYAPPSSGLSALEAVNRLRAAYGRPPLAWDSALAAYAARNYGTHAPGSSGGAAQCWAGVSDPIAAVSMWARSPAHLAIILGATQCVGVSPCPTGCTLNAR